MTLKYEKLDKTFLVKAIEDPIFQREWKASLRRRHVETSVFTRISRIEETSEYVDLFVEEEDDRRRYTYPFISINTLNEINTKYMVRNVHAWSHGLIISLTKKRWNDCDHCKVKFWVDDPLNPSATQIYEHIYDYYNKSLCRRCYEKIPTRRLAEYKETEKKMRASDGQPTTQVVKEYVKLEQRYGLREKTYHPHTIWVNTTPIDITREVGARWTQSK